LFFFACGRFDLRSANRRDEATKDRIRPAEDPSLIAAKRLFLST
jgi:hypothetical protein